ncbi:MAG: ThuA domain-containing protein [Pseudonocardia sp.]|nr:ThuA domain-containing protein [Pseudonocardia sp.]
MPGPLVRSPRRSPLSRSPLRPALAAAAAVLAVIASTTLAAPAAAADTPHDVLVFSKTAGFRHAAIAVGTQAIRDLGTANGFTVTATEDAGAFTAGNLARYETVVFLNTTGDVLDDGQQAAFESYLGSGKGFVGVHAAADTEYGWPFYAGLVGARFASHPAIQPAGITVVDRAHPATAHLPRTWSRTDEWYDYSSNPRSSARVLATLDESSYSGGSMGSDHPIVWCTTYGGGRSFYTGGGHTEASYAEPGFRAHLLGGIRYAAGQADADCRPETGYTSIYDGSTAGWSQAGPGGFTDSDATLRTVGGLGLYWYTAKAYTDYSLKLDWKADGDDNSGVFLGFPPSSDPYSAVDNGYEVQIDATDSADRTTGAVYGFRSADTAARDAALNPPGEWNTYELRVEGPRLQVFLNGVRVNDFTSRSATRDLAGHIGLQNHGAGDDVSFRNVRVKELGIIPGGATTIQAESFSAAAGVQAFPKAVAHNGQTLGYVDPGDWAAYSGVDLTGVTSVSARVVSGGAGGTIGVRTGSVTGPLLGSVVVPNTGGWTTFADISAALSGVPSGPQDLYLTFTGSGSGLFDVDDLTLTTPAGGGGGGVGPVVGLAGKCLDVAGAGTADGTKVQLYTCNGSAAQEWTVNPDGTVRGLGKCLDVAAAGTANGTRVQLWTCNGSGAQAWSAQADGSVVNPASGRCLDVSGNSSVDGRQIHIWDCYGGANQKWSLP